MDSSAALSGEAILQLMIAITVVVVIVGAVSATIAELGMGYWILGWAALLATGALYLAAEAGYPLAGNLAFVTDAIFAPLMLMGALELQPSRPVPRWPLLVGFAAGLLRIALDVGGMTQGHAIHGFVVSPAFFAAAAITTFRAPRPTGLRVPIALLLSALVGFEIWDAWSDWLARENQIMWTALVSICVPLAAFQIASRLMRLGEGIVSAQAASDFAERERDLERWRFETVFDHVRELVAELALDSRILFVNGRVRDLMGLDPAALVGQRALEYVPQEHREQAEEIWREQVETGGLRESVVFPVLDGRGDPLYLEITVSDYAFPDDRRLLVIARDVTDRQVADQQREGHTRLLEERVAERSEQLRASQARLREQERLAAIGTLASGIAHQINNPVGAISAAAEFALLAGDDPDAATIQKAAFERIVEEAGRAGRIVKSVLRFARHEPTTKWLEDLGPVVRRSAELVRPYVLECGGSLAIDAASVSLPILMSPIEIEQMMVNLIRNAAESADGGAAVRVSIRIEDERAMIEVSDNGRGIPPEAKSQVLDPFFTTRLREGGSGLGLSVVHGIVTDHAGEIEIESLLDRGTCVRIRFPIPGVGRANPELRA